MVHKSSLIPGISKFIDNSVLSHYPATSMKRILMAGAISLFLKKNENLVDTLTSNPVFMGLGVMQNDGMIDIELIRDVLKEEVNKSGFIRLTVPFVGDIDFTLDDIDTLYRDIVEVNAQRVTPHVPTTALAAHNGGVY